MNICRKLLCAFLAIIFCFSVFSVSAGAAEQSTAAEYGKFEETIEQQIRAFAKSINQSGADDTAATALAKHGITGRGKKLTVGKNHALTATLMNSELGLETIIRGCSVGIELMQQGGLNSVEDDGGCYWGSNTRRISTTIYVLDLDAAGKVIYKSGWMNYEGTFNSYDTSLIWMAGSMEVHTTITRSKSTAQTITYDISVSFEDEFDFNTNEGSIPREFLSLLGSILFKEFSWIATVNFQLTVPNSCTHQEELGYSDKITAPTCTAKGYTTRTCSHCGYSYKTNYVSKIPHNYKAAITPPTCIAQGYTTYTCSCGNSYVDAYVPVSAHTYRNNICTVCGSRQYLTGDLDTDGIINTSDVVLLRRLIAGGYGVQTPDGIADINKDGIVNSTDVVWLRRYIAGGYGVVLE